MRTLYVLRHGEAVPAQGVADRDRDLTPAGLQAMRMLAPAIERMTAPPTMALCSPALRTRQTYRAVAAGIPVQVHDDLYNATVDELWRYVTGLDDHHAAVLLVGHNPGIHQLAMTMARRGDEVLRQRVTAEYRPGTLAVFRARTLHWADFSPDMAEIIDLRVP